MFKNLYVINKSTGAVLASVVLNPLVRSSFEIEFDENLARVLVVRSGGFVAESMQLGDADIRVEIK